MAEAGGVVVTTVLEALRGGRERILRGWTKGDYARDAAGTNVAADDPTATCWCAVGAVDAAAGDANVAFLAGNVLATGLQGPWARLCVTTFNDAPTTTRDDVVALFDHAIAEASR